MSDFGIQVSSYSVFGRKFSKFYPCEPTDDFLVHETLGLWNVHTFLALLKCTPDKNPQSSRVLPLFRHSCLRLNCIAHMYRQLMILFKSDCHSNASFWIKTFVICVCVRALMCSCASAFAEEATWEGNKTLAFFEEDDGKRLLAALCIFYGENNLVAL